MNENDDVAGVGLLAAAEMAIGMSDEEEATGLNAVVDEGDLETWLNRVKEWARNELAAVGLQTVYLAPTPEGGQISVLDLVKDRPHSPEGLAARVLWFAERTLHHIEAENTKDAVWNTIHLVQAIRLTDFKMEYEQPLGTGMKVRKGASESWKTTREQRKRRDELWQRKALQLRERHPEWSQHNIILQILKEEPPREDGKPWSRSTVLRAIEKLVKPGD